MDNLAYKDEPIIRHELIAGKVVMMSPRPCIEHITAAGNIYCLFWTYLRNKQCRAFGDGVDIYSDERNHFIPDAMIVCNKDIIKHNGIHGAPDLVVEVLSVSTAKNDRGRKMDAYAKAGVKEYWIVSVKDKSVEVYLNRGGLFCLDNIYYHLTAEEIAENDVLPDDDRFKIHDLQTQIKVTVCDDLVVNIADVFEHID